MRLKYKHNPDTIIVLDDLSNRVQQLIEASELTKGKYEGAEAQIQAFQAVLTLIEQVRRYGHVFRGSVAVPDGLLPYIKTPSYQSPLKVEKPTKQ